MANSVGKIFEEQWKKSTPDYVLIYRLPDAAQSFNIGNSGGLRFSKKNPFDYLLWDSQKHILYALELKSVNDKSISFERTKDDRGKIHHHQIQGLKKWDEYDGTICGFVIEFRPKETTIFIGISEFMKLINNISKKSFNLNDLEKHNINYKVIKQKKARTRYTYDVDGFLKSK